MGMNKVGHKEVVHLASKGPSQMLGAQIPETRDCRV